MAYKITFLDRKGKDFFDFLRAIDVDIKAAKNWALETFVLINEKPITMTQIAKLKNDVYIILSEKVFSMETKSLIDENNQGVKFGKILIKRRTIHRDVITEIQTAYAEKKDKVKADLIRLFIVKFFDITDSELEDLPYELVAYMFKEVNTFLSAITEPSKSLDFNDIFTDDSGEIDGESVADMVQPSDETSQENAEESIKTVING